MTNFSKSLLNSKTVIGMIHVQALPGTPKNHLTPNEIIRTAVEEARIYVNEGITTLGIENMHDVPYLNRKVCSAASSLMAIIGYEIKAKTNVRCGVQILAGANKQAVGAAYSANLDFIRAEGFVFAHIADEGMINSDAGDLLRYRKQIGAEEISILTDIKKKHSSHTITSDINLSETAKAAEFFLSDGLIISGSSTGSETDVKDLTDVKQVSKLPIIIGSGITPENIKNYYKDADAFIVGSYFKEDGLWNNKLSSERISILVRKVEEIK
jgi:membrane complex biogenesis BtpA family protein